MPRLSQKLQQASEQSFEAFFNNEQQSRQNAGVDLLDKNSAWTAWQACEAIYGKALQESDVTPPNSTYSSSTGDQQGGLALPMLSERLTPSLLFSMTLTFIWGVSMILLALEIPNFFFAILSVLFGGSLIGMVAIRTMDIFEGAMKTRLCKNTKSPM